MEAQSKSIMLINDMCGYGKVALAAMIPILSRLRHQVFNCPTALVSNTLDYGTFDILETTDYMANAMRCWDELGFAFDAVATGFLVSEEQTRLVAEFCRDRRARGAKIFVDPIMGDEGKLYNGVEASTVSYMRAMCGVAHVVVPNFTEALFLTGLFPERIDGGALTRDEAERLVRAMAELGAESVVITSCPLEDGFATLVYAAPNAAQAAGAEGTPAGTDAAAPAERVLSILPYEEVPVHFPGTGDMFSAVLFGGMLAGGDLVACTQVAMDCVRSMILANAENEDKNKGIPLELHLHEVERRVSEVLA